AVRVEDLYVQPDWRTGAIRIQANVRNALDESDRGGVTFSVAPVASGETLGAAETVYELAPGDTLVEAALAVEDPHLWDIDDPYRYRVTARLSTPNMSSVDESSTCCGFRDFRFEDGYFRLNGRRIYLRCSHTGGCVPIGRRVPQDPDLLRRDLINAKVMGFNSIRFISGMPRPVQLDVCDEIGVMVYEESYAGWYLQDSPWMAERFDRSTTAMIKRDRNHPSVVIWGLLNENFGGEVIRHAAGSLPLIQSLDATRMVMLNSGRHDQQLEIGALANPGSTEWENVLEDRHPYRRVPHTAEIIDYYRTIGGPDLPYFMSEYGVGSAIDLIHAVKHFEQLNASYSEDCQDYMAKRDLFLADWDHWDMAEAFDRPEDFFAQSLGKNAAHRLVGINALRANPNIVGYSLTSTFDPTTSGEGLWTLFRELKPGMVDAIDDGFAPLRWCLFVEPMNVYRHTPAKMEAVLSNEDVLLPGEYPVRIEVFGPNCDRVLERHVTVTIPPSERGSEPPYAMAVFSEDVVIDGPEGEYRLTATFERGGAAVGGEAAFSVVDPVQMPTVEAEVVLWGDDPELVTWLSEHDIRHRPYDPHVERGR
ncbi:MAG: glycoside hydrolase family 2 TIM barrel-domain containing protein, partial [Dehalococcoidia bacterium]|nr:glycoside hydrolase family 2 TIM barrel-domain containing protein [Dehalococcoidia bacterium]